MKKQWWHNRIAYQIYPKSFYDTNGDGIGDLKGITEKLDYLKDLGVDIIWLSPVYVSPLADQGYDIADYQAIDPRFGTMEDMDALLKKAHSLGLYILMDLVVNHCSDEHEWFKKACEDPDGRYGKFFYIKEVKDGELPTNWRSYFGGSVWEKLPGHENKYYLHVFHKKQPDLNWENPDLREEVYKMINWWLDRGLDGFRLDAIINIKKAIPFRSYPADRDDGLTSIDNMLAEASGIGKFLGEMRNKTFRPHDSFTVGEVFNEKPEELPDFIGENGYFSSMYDFSANVFGRDLAGWHAYTDITPDDYRDCVFAAQKKVSKVGFISNIIENHDEPRGVCRYLPEEGRTDAGKKLLATVYFLLHGLPWIYQGQELGMENLHFTSIEEVDDISSIDSYNVALDAGLTPEKAIKVVEKFSRDNARTPFQWDDSENAGFTKGTPWLRVNPNYTELNLKDQKDDPDSVFNYYKKLIDLRKNSEYSDTFVYGSFEPWLDDTHNITAYLRKTDSKTMLVAGNFSDAEQTIALPSKAEKTVLSNLPDVTLTDDSLTLRPWQAVVLEL